MLSPKVCANSLSFSKNHKTNKFGKCFVWKLPNHVGWRFQPLWKILVITSSTAQGGGGSFKNRKPIGELGCCESGMAERIHWWTERCLRSPLFLSLFLWLSTYLPAYLLCIYLSIDLSISLFLSFISLPIYLSTSLPIYLCTYLPMYLSTYLSIYRSIYLSISLSLFHLSTCLAVYLFICGAVSFSVI